VTARRDFARSVSPPARRWVSLPLRLWRPRLFRQRLKLLLSAAVDQDGLPPLDHATFANEEGKVGQLLLNGGSHACKPVPGLCQASLAQRRNLQRPQRCAILQLPQILGHEGLIVRRARIQRCRRIRKRGERAGASAKHRRHNGTDTWPQHFRPLAEAHGQAPHASRWNQNLAARFSIPRRLTGMPMA
jgi:hypothetical protein